MNSTIKISQGADFKAVFADVLKICERFWTDTKMLEISVEPVFGKASSEQNRLQHVWFKEAQKQGQMTASEYRADCKAYCGLPILFRDSDEYREAFDRLIRDRYTVEEKVELMAPPMDYPVSRGMNKKQKSEYLESVYLRLTTKHKIHLVRDEEQAA